VVQSPRVAHLAEPRASNHFHEGPHPRITIQDGSYLAEPLSCPNDARPTGSSGLPVRARGPVGGSARRQAARTFNTSRNQYSCRPHFLGEDPLIGRHLKRVANDVIDQEVFSFTISLEDSQFER
jgi:hypothetical protein